MSSCSTTRLATEEPDKGSAYLQKKQKIEHVCTENLQTPRRPLSAWFAEITLADDFSHDASLMFWTDYIVRGGALPASLPTNFSVHRAEVFKASLRKLDRIISHASDRNEGKNLSAFKLAVICSSNMHLYRFGELIGSQKLRRLSRLQLLQDSKCIGLALKNICAPKNTTVNATQAADALPTRLHCALFAPRTIRSSFSSEDGSVPSDHPVNSCDLLISTETHQRNNRVLRFASSSTGKEILKIWLSSCGHIFGDLGFHRGTESIYVKSSVFSHLPADPSHSADKRIIVTFWELFPFRYTGGFAVRDAVFGKGLSGVGDFEDTLVVCYKANSKEFIELFDLKPFFNDAQVHSIIYGQKWDERKYPHSTNGELKLSNSFGFLPENLRVYGFYGCGMPLTFDMTSKPPVLIKIFTSMHFVFLSLHLHHFLIADKKANEFYFINAATGQRVESSILRGAEYCDSPAFELSSLLLYDSKEERLAVWSGVCVIIYVIRRFGTERKLLIEEDSRVYPPDMIETEGCVVSEVTIVSANKKNSLPTDFAVLTKEYATGNWTCDLVSYCYDLDVLMIMFCEDLSEKKKSRCFLALLDGSSCNVLAVVPLRGSNLHATDHKSEMELDEYGLSHYYTDIGGNHTMDIYSLKRLDDDQGKSDVVYKVFMPPTSVTPVANPSGKAGEWIGLSTLRF